ncbi:hypothetical protein BHE74_00052547 [Ensete ventricosum]|nr:hypothetical protein BHE74_00052547 [Ensete ventricosum]
MLTLRIYRRWTVWSASQNAGDDRDIYWLACSHGMRNSPLPLTTPHHSKHRLHFPSPNTKAPAATDHPVEVVGRIRNLPADLRKDKDGPAACSDLEISGDGRSLRVRADVGYRDFTLDGVSMSEHEDPEAFYRRFVASA